MGSSDSCAFCLAALGGAAGTLVLPCGHAFHATCALQFLLKRKQCIVCRAPVDESRVLDASQLPPEAAGRQFVPPPSPSAADGQHGSGNKKSSTSSGSSGAPQIEMLAFAGSSAAAAAAGVVQPYAVPPTSGSEYLPDYLNPSPRAASLGQAGPAPFVGVLVEGAAQPPLASQPPQPLRTITVVRPRHWARRLVLVGIFFLLLAVITAVPIIIARHGGSSDDSGKPSELECYTCFFNSPWECPKACDKYFKEWGVGHDDR